MSRPLLLDLFCGAGGAAMGYWRAGFDVVGVDIKPQPRYPFRFIVGDALGYLGDVRREGLRRFDAIHASPPCQAYSDLKHRTKGTYPDLVGQVRQALVASGLPYVIENVEGAPLLNPVTLCGTMFPGLRVIRHRLFESNRPLGSLPQHGRHPLVYTRDKRKAHYGKLDEWAAFVSVNGGGNCSVAAARDAMGIDWMTKAEINEAIPPAYTEFIGRQLIAALEAAA